VDRFPLCLYDRTGEDYSGYGSKIHIWNVCDTSKLKVTNITINKQDSETACVNGNWHGPTGRWYNAAACDYYGKFGLYAQDAFSPNNFYNYGVFRLMVGGRGTLKSLYDVEYSYEGVSAINIEKQLSAGGNASDQINAQGYQSPTDLARTLPAADMRYAFVVPEGGAYVWQQQYLGYRGLQTWTSGLELQFGKGLAGWYQEPGVVNGLWTHAHIEQGAGMMWDMGQLHPEFAVPPLHMKWDSYLDNYLDETACNLFANSKHGANKKIGLCSIYKSYTPPLTGGEGRDGPLINSNPLTFGFGVRSLNIFDLSQLV